MAFLFKELEDFNIRKHHIDRSAKKGGSSDTDAKPYLHALGVELSEKKLPIQFTPNINEHIHRWAPYVQGFSASFVQSVISSYRNIYRNLSIMDPFCGCGTVLVQAKLNGLFSAGTELNPFLHFIANTKLNSWNVDPNYFLKCYKNIPKNRKGDFPHFLKSEKHYNTDVLDNLKILKGGIESLSQKGNNQNIVKNLLWLAFSSILIDCSNLKRTPCLGYSKSKKVLSEAPFILFDQKVNQIADDLRKIQNSYRECIDVKSKVLLENAATAKHDSKFDLIITSPPYMNGMDYVMNYKIEMGWLGFSNSQRELKAVKDNMVVCDNVSKGLIRSFSNRKERYNNQWLEKIISDISQNILERGAYRRPDMPFIVSKYFDDMYKVMENSVSYLKEKGRFILVVGDSLIADVYVPTDLMLAKIGLDLGLEIESIAKARSRRSGQVRTYRLRESVVTLRKS